ncbi:hypothetical protein K9M16_05135, partial [Candidatus Babeliales bacterium]|nr:hypothetical protein [Candidatus Babeliales bacterium]
YNEQDSCSDNLVCSLYDNACCNAKSDGICNSNCGFIDPDCGGTSSTTSEDEDNYISIGTCYYSEGSEDDCSDGVFEYSWIGNWQWEEENSFTGSQYATDLDYVMIDGTYKYDPLNEDGKRASSKCQGGSNTIKCPEKIEVPFFNLFNFIISIILLIIVYAIIINKKELSLKIYK